MAASDTEGSTKFSVLVWSKLTLQPPCSQTKRELVIPPMCRGAVYGKTGITNN